MLILVIGKRPNSLIELLRPEIAPKARIEQSPLKQALRNAMVERRLQEAADEPELDAWSDISSEDGETNELVSDFPDMDDLAEDGECEELDECEEPQPLFEDFEDLPEIETYTPESAKRNCKAEEEPLDQPFESQAQHPLHNDCADDIDIALDAEDLSVAPPAIEQTLCETFDEQTLSTDTESTDEASHEVTGTEEYQDEPIIPELNVEPVSIEARADSPVADIEIESGSDIQIDFEDQGEQSQSTVEDISGSSEDSLTAEADLPSTPTTGTVADETQIRSPMTTVPLLEHPSTGSPAKNSRSSRRSLSAAAEETVAQEVSTKPRISDDTAILQAFLSRAAADKATRKRSIHKRESLSNRRDSGAIRQALASPAKVEVLGELDPNSPSPRKPAPELNLDDKPALQSKPEPENRVDNATVQEVRPARRSARSRTQIPRFPPVAPPPAATPATGPKSFTIRGPTEKVALQRTEVQELALVTRNNTRRNKAGAVMPAMRIVKLATEAASPEGSAEASPAKRGKARHIRWDTTLVYFNDGEPDLADLGQTEAAPQAKSKPAEAENKPVATDTAAKSKARRLGPSRKATATPGKAPSEPLPTEAKTEEQPAAPTEEKPKAAPAPVKKRSRIATPAKGLLSAASLLPADVEVEVRQAATKTASSSSDTASGAGGLKKPSSRRIPAPRKLNLLGVPTAANEGRENENRLSTPKKMATAVPSVKTAAPKLEALKFEPEMPGLASPAKKRSKSVVMKAAVAGMKEREREEDVMPGLSSPAKKRVRSRVL